MSERGGILRPLPFRGDLIAAGGVPLAVGVVLLATRMANVWDAGWIALACGAAAALLLALGWRAPIEGATPRAYASALLLAAFAPAAVALVALAAALHDDVGSGALTWVALVLAGLYALVAAARASAACALLAAVTAVVALCALTDWIVDPDGRGLLRATLAAALTGLVAGWAALRDRRPAHARALALAGGVAALGLAVASSGSGTPLPGYAPTLGAVIEVPAAPGAGAVWEAIVLGAGAAILLVAATARDEGMAWMGGVVLAAFAALAVQDEASLLWWPLVLLLASAAMVGGWAATRRGELLGGGGVALAVAVVVVDLRFAGTWAAGARLAVGAAGAAALLALVRTAPGRDDEGWPRGALLVAAFPVLALALLALADALGASRAAAGTVAGVALALAVVYAAFAVARGSAACTLLAAAAAVVALVAGAQSIFDPGTPHGHRWLLLAAIAALTIGVVRLRDGRHRQAVALAVAAGLTALALAQLLQLLLVLDVVAALDDLDGAFPEVATGWELLLLVTGFGLVAFGAVDRANGPVWIGAAVLLSFAALAALADASVLWWPLLLIALGLGVVCAGLRPTTPAPPPPDADAPPASTTPLTRLEHRP